ncbi:oligosaccharyl transferase glycoprotein complex, beta subunit [Cladophialophora chaetospira]|uniref:Dolichyl-diphosphooligosaccharide--protein glycosyltransferase subunit WBP1 n=1 Tax=Cladophialophora chaetospira TaxID=386627 RepID=A0AA39CKC3_9EURO|nr:oligosaccharyl transferase glycoprotein complex, beta subunit [Cladophialophora chaetospira]
MLLFSSLCLLLSLFQVALAKSAVGDRLLVVLEDESQQGLYSKFWADLESRNFKLTFQSPRDDSLSLFRHGAVAYEHVFLTPPKSKGYGPALTPKILLDYVNAGGNVLLGLSSESGTPSAISSLLLEFDISLSPDKNSLVVDHFKYDTVSAAEKHDVLLLNRPGPLRSDVVNFFGGDGLLALPKAVGQTLGNTSPLLSPILKAPATAYVYNPKEEGETVEELFATGSQLALVSAVQARNSARFTVLGSLEMLQDKWFEASVKPIQGKNTKTANQEFARQLTEWTFKEVGVLKVFNIQHHELVASTKSTEKTTAVGEWNPEIYRIKNDVEFSIAVGQYDKTHWIPFTVPANDALQLEFSMLSPFHRIPLSPSSTTPNSTIFSTKFTTPDQHGIFAFKVNYKRPFLTTIEEKRQVTVRHFAHDEWPRSWAITGAWPWIGGLWSVIVGFLAFVVVWMYAEPPKEEVERRRKLSVSTATR